MFNFLDMVKFLDKLFFDQRGEYQPTTPGQAAPAPATEAATAPSEDTEGTEGQGEETPPAAPKYGEFGDDPDRVWQEFNKLKPQLDQYKGKITATERNLAALRKTLDSSGIQVVSDEQGNVRLLPKESQTSKQRRFTDEHKSLFDSKVLQAIELRAQDLIDDALEGYTKKNEEMSNQQRQFVNIRNESNELMIKYFPQLKVGGENFNEAFYNRATEIWEAEHKNDPRGELIASLKAAQELNVIPQAINQAKKEGVELGKAEKKILAPVSSGSSGKSSGFKKLDKEEYLKLPADERTKYDKQLVEQRK